MTFELNMDHFFNKRIPQNNIVFQLQSAEDHKKSSYLSSAVIARWGATKRLSVTAKQTVAPLQGQEIGKLKSRCWD